MKASTSAGVTADIQKVVERQEQELERRYRNRFHVAYGLRRAQVSFQQNRKATAYRTNCRNKAVRKGHPKFKKHCRFVEYKVSGWKLTDFFRCIVSAG